MGALRVGAKQGENVEAFGQVLATSDNFTTGIVTALAGIGDDSRFYQISAPVQPGNSGGPLLYENGNIIGVVSAKLNFLSEIKNAGDIPQNVNFAIKASVVANFLQDNAIKFQLGEATQAMKGPRPGRRGERSQRVHRVPLTAIARWLVSGAGQPRARDAARRAAMPR